MTSVPSFNPAEFARTTNVEAVKIMDLVGLEFFAGRCGLKMSNLKDGAKFYYMEWETGFVSVFMPTARLVKENRLELVGGFSDPSKVVCCYTKGYELLMLPMSHYNVATVLPFQVEGYPEDKGKRYLPITNRDARISF